MENNSHSYPNSVFLDTLENVDDVNSIVDAISKLQQDHLTLTSELNQDNEEIHHENEQLLLNIQQQQLTIDEYIQTKNEFEKRLFDNEQELNKIKQDLQEKIHQYQYLQNEYHLYKEDQEKNSQIAIINIEQSSPPIQTNFVPIQQTTETNDW